MKSTGLLLLVLLPTLAFAQSQNKKKHSIPAVFDNAHYVWVESTDGDIFTPGLLPADRHAIVDVQNALRNWGRYVLTPDRSDAELIFVVRTGRIAEGKVGGSVGCTQFRAAGQSQFRTATASDGIRCDARQRSRSCRRFAQGCLEQQPGARHTGVVAKRRGRPCQP